MDVRALRHIFGESLATSATEIRANAIDTHAVSDRTSFGDEAIEGSSMRATAFTRNVLVGMQNVAECGLGASGNNEVTSAYSAYHLR